MVNNLAEHSNATKASITFLEKGKTIYLEVADNGIGFNKEREHNRNGVKNIIRRAEQIGGEATVISEPGQGTTWTFKLKA
jgi:signal transduction histidine kinase